MPRIAALKPQQVPADSKPTDESDGFYAYLVGCARASERITPEGLEQVYAMSVSVSTADIDRLVAEGELEPGTLRPLRS
jgi:hypothetical protein